MSENSYPTKKNETNKNDKADGLLDELKKFNENVIQEKVIPVWVKNWMEGCLRKMKEQQENEIKIALQENDKMWEKRMRLQAKKLKKKFSEKLKKELKIQKQILEKEFSEKLKKELEKQKQILDKEWDEKLGKVIKDHADYVYETDNKIYRLEEIETLYNDLRIRCEFHHRRTKDRDHVYIGAAVDHLKRNVGILQEDIEKKDEEIKQLKHDLNEKAYFLEMSSKKSIINKGKMNQELEKEEGSCPPEMCEMCRKRKVQLNICEKCYGHDDSEELPTTSDSDRASEQEENDGEVGNM